MVKEITDLKSTSDQDIITTINEAKKEAINAVKELEMIFSDKELEDIISRPLDETRDCDDKDDNDDDDDDGYGDSAEVDQCKKDIAQNEDLHNDISVMQKVGVIDKSVCDALQKTYKCIDNSTVPLYVKINCNEKKKFSHLLK